MNILESRIDRRCFLWRNDGSSAGTFLLPREATRYPKAIQIWEPLPKLYWSSPSCANMYRATPPWPSPTS